MAWEREQWAIFVDWNARYEAGVATPGSHPGHGGVDARYDDRTRTLLELGSGNTSTIVFPAPIDLIAPFLGRGHSSG